MTTEQRTPEVKAPHKQQSAGATRTWILAGIAAVVVLAAAVVAGISGYRYWDQRQTEQSRTAAVEAANHTVTAMFSYKHETVAEELPRAADGLAEPFRAQYLELIEKAIVPGAKEKALSVTATSQAGGVVSADREQAVVLLFLNQVITSNESPQGQVSGSRVRVRLDKSDDRWLVTAVEPI